LLLWAKRNSQGNIDGKPQGPELSRLNPEVSCYFFKISHKVPDFLTQVSLAPSFQLQRGQERGSGNLEPAHHLPDEGKKKS